MRVTEIKEEEQKKAEVAENIERIKLMMKEAGISVAQLSDFENKPEKAGSKRKKYEIETEKGVVTWAGIGKMSAKFKTALDESGRPIKEFLV